uniref:Protein GOLM2 n=1 Tax=Labrus bergylta TaxID=56723 RepID=A0A3Q3E750_9LABR
MIGFGANRRGGRLPSFILIFLMVVIAILSFNYWTVSNRHGRLLDELAEVQTQVDTHRKQIDQKDGDYSVLEGKIQAREGLIKKCTDEKMKLQGEATAQMTEIQRLKEQLTDLKQEFMKQEEQLREVKKNSTTLERKLEYESLQCGRQIAQLKDEYEETKKAMEVEATKLRQGAIDRHKGAGASRHEDGALGVDMEGERHTVANHRHESQDLKDEMGKPGSDAGMPGIEDSEVGKVDDVQFALKKPAITQKHEDAPESVVGAGAGPRVGAADGPGAQALSLDEPRLQDRVETRGKAVAAPGIMKQADKPIVFEEDNKAGIKADELGEQQRQIQVPDHVKGDGEHLKAIPLPPNPAQVPNPIQPHQAKDHAQAEPVHHRQNDEDRDMQGDRAVDYGKRHQAIDIL